MPDPTGKIGVARRQRIGTDALSGKLERKALRIVDERGLDGAIGSRGEVDLATGDACDRYDRGGLAGFEIRHGGANEAHAVHQVDLEGMPPSLLGIADL